MNNETGMSGMNAIHMMDFEQIKNIPVDRLVTCARTVVNLKLQEQGPNRVCITTS